MTAATTTEHLRRAIAELRAAGNALCACAETSDARLLVRALGTIERIAERAAERAQQDEMARAENGEG